MLINVKEVPGKDIKKLFFRMRGRFLKLQRDIVGEALDESAKPIVAAAKSAAPRRTGLLAARMGDVVLKKGNKVRMRIGPTFLRKNEKGGPYYARFQEKGWRATGRANRRTAKNPRQIPGKHFLGTAARSNIEASFRIFQAQIFKRFAESPDSA